MACLLQEEQNARFLFGFGAALPAISQAYQQSSICKISAPNKINTRRRRSTTTMAAPPHIRNVL
eukprot:11218254-Lingulodinium_polyedra.AAC.1